MEPVSWVFLFCLRFDIMSLPVIRFWENLILIFSDATMELNLLHPQNFKFMKLSLSNQIDSNFIFTFLKFSWKKSTNSIFLLKESISVKHKYKLTIFGHRRLNEKVVNIQDLIRDNRMIAVRIQKIVSTDLV